MEGLLYLVDRNPRENPVEFILLPQIYGYSDLQIEVVFYISTWIEWF